ncbi:DUF7312 domain-containing protein [Halorubrum tebenquichense]|uniref:DUF7312 domain-containing protein n=1 Tax=Halorubrum tebenquichense DSM 14210 TaxID=1227485 RepID=M0DD36_9EURY|nr:hypothetical protein [Halorubrum tebenquichense]ELZ32044.1 hypothetical protein C472_15854 [Halorubrum tebenquichense DSM 14210]
MSDESGDGARDEGPAADAGDGARDDAPVSGDGSRANDAGDGTPGDAEGDGGEWRFSVDEVGPDGVTEDTATPESEPIEPGDVTLEHAVFVVLGVALTVGVLVVGF